MNETQIDSEKYYSAKQVALMGILPWSSNMTFTKVLSNPYWADIFKPIVERKATNRRFYIKGENIIHFLQLAKEGKLNQP